MLKFRLQEPHLALQAARTRQTTDEFKQRYATRAGVEGTVSFRCALFEESDVAATSA
jgi:transposase